MIRLIDRTTKGEEYKWVKDPNTDECLKNVPFSIHKMLAQDWVRSGLLVDRDGTEFGVKAIGIQAIDVGVSYDHQRAKALKKFGHFKKDDDLTKLPLWEWVVIRSDDKRFRFKCNSQKPHKTFQVHEWPIRGPPLQWIQPPSTGPGIDSVRRVDGLHYFRRAADVSGLPPSGDPPVDGGAGSRGQARGSGGDGPGRSAGSSAGGTDKAGEQHRGSGGKGSNADT